MATEMFEIDFYYAESLVKLTNNVNIFKEVHEFEISEAVIRLKRLHERYCLYEIGDYDWRNVKYYESYDGDDVIAWKYAQGLSNLMKIQNVGEKARTIEQLKVLSVLYPHDYNIENLVNEVQQIVRT